MIKIATILGARPQFIKASVVSHAIKKIGGINEFIVHTGQHYDSNMSDVFFEELNIDKPSYSLNINGGTHGSMTGRMLETIEKVLIYEKPNAVIVYGDTNSTLAGALAASKLGIPIAHIEAGLRSFNMNMPEEINRILTDRISRWLFAPTRTAVNNLKNEGYDSKNIHLVGDVMFDASLHYSSKFSNNQSMLERLALKEKNYILATIHRAENTDNIDRLNIIADALIAVSKKVPVVWPMHPRTLAVLKSINKFESLRKFINLVEPLSYSDMVQLERSATLIATDSGGVQKEAYFFKVPCVTLRDETEWVELINSGWNKLCPPMSSVDLCDILFSSIGHVGDDVMHYGDGDSSTLIAKILLSEIK